MINSAYKKSGVDVQAGYESVRLIREHVARTKIPGVMSELGDFAGAFKIANDYKNPVLISGTDGVGTKLKIAFAMNKHNTIGIDCVAMCVNDILCNGAKPIFFLDYLALGKNYPELVAEIVSGVCEGCVQAECALIGGETAEMPGFYPDGEYDLAGFAVGIAEQEDLLEISRVKSGDAIIALASSGVHSNGFSLVRKIVEGRTLDWHIQEFGKTLGEELLIPTRIYVREVLRNIKLVKSMAHITGGGFYENIPRCLPKNLVAKIERSRLRILPVFEFLQREGKVDASEMFGVFNMGVGMVLVVSPENVDEILRNIPAAYLLGEVSERERENESEGVVFC